ncbi:MAG: GntG family PLP-dependent aldolase [Solirubrobacteraceae bacterium]
MTALVSFFDTATEPTEAMRDAMRSARVGDDVYGRDPTVRELEARAAALVGKEQAVLVPSGTMANLAAIMAHTSRGDAVLLEAQSHVGRAEAGGVAVVAGCMPLEVAGRRGVLCAADVEARLAPPDQHRPPARLLCVENTHNRAGGTVTPPEVMDELRELCGRWALRLHVDGARLFNAAVALELPPAALAADADSVCFALSKGLGAPVGSLLAGTAEFVAEARRMRKLLGGGMRQAGVLAAAGLVALDGWRHRLAEDHRRAARLARRLATLPGVMVEPEAVTTNIVLCELEPAGVPAAEVIDWLLVRGISCSATSARGLRFVVHGQIGDLEVERLAEAMAQALERRVAP